MTPLLTPPQSTHFVVAHDSNRSAIPFSRFLPAYNFAKRTDGVCLEVYPHEGQFYLADGRTVNVKVVNP